MGTAVGGVSVAGRDAGAKRGAVTTGGSVAFASNSQCTPVGIFASGAGVGGLIGSAGEDATAPPMIA